MARQKARGKSEEGLGDFTFLYTVWFYCVHLLRVKKTTTENLNHNSGQHAHLTPSWIYAVF
ncbi:hypothetical protein FJR37_20710 [Aphanizomenon sp. UHCC 0183]|nr:hypothetical protein [Aphanizomenon sp. UHCC 0183]